MRQYASISVLYALILCLSSFLMFLAQPILGKMLLPWLGGTPAVWNTCMLFFQAVLLLSYLYAHLVTTKLRPSRQLLLHACVLAVPLFFLPPQLSETLRTSGWLSEHPIGWVLLALTTSIGPAFFTVATTSPLLQAWFARTDHPKASNPYPLYAASNIGSLLALLGYPFFIEPALTLGNQTTSWAIAYGLLITTIGLAGFLALRYQRSDIAASPTRASTLREKQYADDDGIESWTQARVDTSDLRQYLQWIVLAALPSSLMLGTTSFLTTDIAAIPMLWLIPLSLYTLSFVMVFARYSPKSDGMMSRLLPFLVIPTLFLILAEYRQSLWLIICLHLVTFFSVAVTCHGRLALSKPDARHLTAFYFCLALGGVLGGAFNTLIAPAIFNSIVEYPAALVLALILCRPAALENKLPITLRRYATPMIAGLFGALLMWGMTHLYKTHAIDNFVNTLTLPFDSRDLSESILYATPLLFASVLMLGRRPLLWSSMLAGVCCVALSLDAFDDTVLHKSRSFFGTLTVRRYDAHTAHSLTHGGILHGEQFMANATERAEPRSYYHRSGPLGQVMEVIDEMVESPHIGVIGLGTGAIAAYGRPQNSLTFYELDPNVENLARNTKLFTYVDDCLKRWCKLKVVLGDGRLKLAESSDYYDLLVIDAFSSDAIPVHLLTVEAMQTYFSKLTSAGILALHISNRYVDLEPVLYNLAMALDLGYAVRKDEADELTGKDASTWVILAAQEGLFDKIAVDDSRWTGLNPKESVGLWRDDYANVARAFMWN